MSHLEITGQERARLFELGERMGLSREQVQGVLDSAEWNAIQRKLAPADTGEHTAPVQWEYASHYLRPTAEDPMAPWTHWGRHGWELVAVAERVEGRLGYFKRRRVTTPA